MKKRRKNDRGMARREEIGYNMKVKGDIKRMVKNNTGKGVRDDGRLFESGK